MSHITFTFILFSFSQQFSKIMGDKEEEGSSTGDDNPKPEAPDSLANEEQQDPASAETNFSGNENAQAAAKDKSKSKFS